MRLCETSTGHSEEKAMGYRSAIMFGDFEYDLGPMHDNDEDST
jgi:hypothetical protein